LPTSDSDGVAGGSLSTSTAMRRTKEASHASPSSLDGRRCLTRVMLVPSMVEGTRRVFPTPASRKCQCDGTRVPYSATGGGITRPRRPFEGSPREPPDGRLAGPHGPGVAFRHPRIGDFCSRFALIAPHDPPSREAAVASALRRPAGPHHCWCFAACGRTGPPGTGHSTVAYLPGADRCHVRCRIQTSR
jgi:hypothetical protein